MKSWSNILLLVAVVTLAGHPVLAQRTGTYRSTMSGSWNDPDIWELWNGSVWGSAPRVPGPVNDVIIANGDTVTPSNVLFTVPDTCRNLYVQVNGVVRYTGVVIGARNVLVYGDTVNNSGTVGGSGDKCNFLCMSSVAFTGTTTNVFDVNSVQANASGITIKFGDDFKVHGPVFGGTCDSVRYQVGGGDTLEFYGGGDFYFGSSSTDTARVSGWFDCNGAVITGPGSKFNISVGGGKFSFLSLPNSGTMTRGDTLFADGPGTGSETVTLNGTITHAAADTQKFHTLSIGRTAGATINFPVVINKELSLDNGWLACPNGLFMANLAKIARTTTCSLKTTPVFRGKVNLEYWGDSLLLAGREVPDADSAINNASIFANLNLTKDFNCYGSLSVADTVVTGSYILSARGTASASSGGYVNGKLEWSIPTGSVVTRQYFVGTNNGYSPATVTFYNVSVPGLIWFNATQGEAGYMNHTDRGLKRHWLSFHNVFATFDSGRVTTTYLPVDFNTNFIEATDEATMVVGQYSGSAWSYPRVVSRNPGGTADGGTIEVIVNYLHFSTLTAGKDIGTFENVGPTVNVIRPASTYDTLGPYTVRAVLIDNGKSIVADTLFYSRHGEMSAMTHSSSSGDTFNYLITGPFSPGTVVDYYLKARDDEGAVTYAPEPRGVTNGMPMAHYTLKTLIALPPQNLEAVGQDHAVSLTWDAPRDVLDYTNGFSATVDSLQAGDYIVTRFTPLHSPCFVDSALTRWGDRGSVTDSVEVHLWPDDGSGLPDTTNNLIAPFKIRPVHTQLVKADINKLVPYCKDFYIGYRMLQDSFPIPYIQSTNANGIRTLIYNGSWTHLFDVGFFPGFFQQVYCTYDYTSKDKGVNPDSSSLAQYDVLRGTAPGGPYSIIGGSYGGNYSDSTAINGTNYYYVVEAYYGNPYMKSVYSNEVSAIPAGVTGELEQPGLPRTYALQAACPNPSRGQTVIKYQLPKASNVQFQVYNVAGQLVKVCNEGIKPAGYHQINLNNGSLSNGIYFYQLRAGEFSATKKLVVLK
jgi:hypothetical protein